MTERVLCIHPETDILGAGGHHSAPRFDIDVASGGPDGLQLIRDRGPYAVIVTDLGLPRADGLDILLRARDLSPGTVLLALTGNASDPDVVEAVNEARLFRLLPKPCPPGTFARALEAGVEQHRRAAVERELLEKTRRGSIQLLSEILSLVNPAAFGRAARLRRYVRHMARQLKLKGIGQYELAALLSQIGCITLPSETVEKVFAGEAIDGGEQETYARHPAVGARLLSAIPQLEALAAMVERQSQPWTPGPTGSGYGGDPIRTGAALLHVAIEFDDRLGRGLPASDGLAEMRHRGEFDPTMLAALENIHLLESLLEPRLVRVNELRLHMVLDADVRARTGILLVARGQDVTHSVIECLRNFARRVGVLEPLRVLVPRVALLEDDHAAEEEASDLEVMNPRREPPPEASAA